MTKLDSHALRRAFGSFMTGVTIVTALDGDGVPVGFTANSFSSVSMDPPLLLICPGKFLSSYHSFANCSHFAINVLAEGQEAVSNTFASFKGDRFGEVLHHPDLHGVPLITGAIAQFSCSTHQIVPAGDHCILIGQVEAFSHTEKPGLGYIDGKYFSLGLERAASRDMPGTTVCGAIIEAAGQVLLEKTANGFRPPQIVSTDRAGMAQTLSEKLTANGFGARLGQAYSVFDDRESGVHHAYFLAKGAEVAPQSDVHAVAICDLAGLRYSTPAIETMMTRFALEARTGDFALYLGDTLHGDVHMLRERS